MAVNSNGKDRVAESAKAPTGIHGFVQVTCGGIPRGKITLVTGSPGFGKTVFGLQTLANAALLWNEPGIFVTFEENSRQLIANATKFGWNVEESEKLFFLDGMPDPDIVAPDKFDFSPMLALVSAKVQATKARRIVFDSLDALLHLLPGSVEKRREMHRLHGYLMANDLTAMITVSLDSRPAVPLPFEESDLLWISSIVDCVIVLAHPFEWSR